MNPFATLLGTGATAGIVSILDRQKKAQNTRPPTIHVAIPPTAQQGGKLSSVPIGGVSNTVLIGAAVALVVLLLVIRK